MKLLLQLTISFWLTPRFHLGIYIAVAAFNPIFMLCSINSIISLKYHNTLKNTKVNAPSAEQFSLKKSNQWMSVLQKWSSHDW